MNVKIVNATEQDSEGYLDLKIDYLREYYEMSNKKIKLSYSNLKNKLKKQFNENLISRSRYLLLAKENKNMLGFLVATKIKNVFQSQGYIDDMYVKKEFRRQGIATKMILEFKKVMAIQKIKKIRLGVDINNDSAIKFYKKMGFQITQYEMEMVK